MTNKGIITSAQETVVAAGKSAAGPAPRASRPEMLNRKRPKDDYLMDMNMNTKTTASKPAGFPKTDGPKEFREMAEKGTAQAKETYEKMSAATTEAADLIKDSYAMGVKGIQDFNNKFLEFAHANTNAAFNFSRSCPACSRLRHT